jgi:hypothetical protein
VNLTFRCVQCTPGCRRAEGTLRGVHPELSLPSWLHSAALLLLASRVYCGVQALAATNMAACSAVGHVGWQAEGFMAIFYCTNQGVDSSCSRPSRITSVTAAGTRTHLDEQLVLRCGVFMLAASSRLDARSCCMLLRGTLGRPCKKSKRVCLGCWWWLLACYGAVVVMFNMPDPLGLRRCNSNPGTWHACACGC